MIKNINFIKPINKLANEIIKNNNKITSSDVNLILKDLGLSISQEKLDKINQKEFIVFEEIDENIIKTDKFKSNLGDNKNKIPGIYIWTHKETGQKYVGSSTQLSRRLIGYIKGTHNEVGKFIPLLYKDGLKAFNLKVLILKEDYEPNLELLIEQYYLLQKEYNLNTLKIVNSIIGARSKALFMYNMDCTELIYSSSIQEDFIFNLGIHHSIFSDCLLTGELYLNKYKFTNELIDKAKNKDMSLEEVKIMLDNDRLEFKLLNSSRNPIILKDNEGNIVKIFDSVKDCLEYLNTIGPSNKTTLLRRIKSKTLYHGYICEWNVDKVKSLKDKAISVKVIDIITNEEIIFSSYRQAALHLSSTGQTIKQYAMEGNIFNKRYKISIE